MCNDIMVSVIIPVYNSKNYLENTIQSVLNQSYKNFELLLIDDGSTDESGIICDKYKELDSRVKCIHQTNGGISHARNIGIENARGKYIAFSDDDDEMSPKCLKSAVAFAEKEKLDLVRYNYRHEYIDGTVIKKVRRKTFPKEIVEHISTWNDYMKIIRCGQVVWAGIYNRNFINHNRIRFDETILYGIEDYIFLISCIMQSKRTGILPECLYTWKQRKAHSTSCITSREAFDNRLMAILKWIDADEQVQKHVRMTEIDKNLRNHAYAERIMSETIICNLSLKETNRIINDLKQKINFKKMTFKAYCRVNCKRKIKYLCVDISIPMYIKLYKIWFHHKAIWKR